MTELYMLQDKSTEHQGTWTFLERRIEEGHQIQGVLDMGDQTTKKALTSAFLTVSFELYTILRIILFKLFSFFARLVTF